MRAAAVAEAAALAAVLALQAFLNARVLDAGTTYDEGVYLASLDALRDGERLGADVFASQPPGWYAVLRASAGLFGDSVGGVRTGIVVLGLLGTIGAALAVRALAGPAAGVLAAAFVTVAPPIPLFAARVLSDLASVHLVFLALAAAEVGRRLGGRRAVAAAALAGGLLALACSVKVSAVVALPAVVLVLPVTDRRKAWWAAGGAAVVAGVLLGANAGALGELWGSVVTYHDDLRGVTVVSEPRSVLADETLDVHAAFTWIAVAALVASLVALVRTRRVPAAPYVLLVVLTATFLLWHRPLFVHHATILAAVLALWAAAALGTALPPQGRLRAAALALAGLVALAGYVQQHRRVGNESPPEEPAVLAAARLLEERTPRGSTVVTDVPIVAYRAGRLVPGQLVDTSFTRFASGSLTDDEVAAAVDAECAAAVAIGRTFGTRPALAARLVSRFEDRRSLDGITVATRRRSPCG